MPYRYESTIFYEVTIYTYKFLRCCFNINSLSYRGYTVAGVQYLARELNARRSVFTLETSLELFDDTRSEESLLRDMLNLAAQCQAGFTHSESSG